MLRTYDLTSVLTLTTGRAMSPDLGDVYHLIDTIGCGATRLAAELVLQQHPRLRGAQPPADRSAIPGWLADMERQHGVTLAVEDRP